MSWELELFDLQPSTTGGLEKDLLFGGRLDDKLCSWSAMQALINSSNSFSQCPRVTSDAASASASAKHSLKVCALFDDEEIGSLLRQGARGNFLPSTIERINASLPLPGYEESYGNPPVNARVLHAQTMAKSFLISADVTHAVNPNFLDVYLPQHAPQLNVGLTVAADSNGHMTTDAVSTAFLQRCAQESSSRLQVFQIRNDTRSGGTV